MIAWLVPYFVDTAKVAYKGNLRPEFVVELERADAIRKRNARAVLSGQAAAERDACERQLTPEAREALGVGPGWQPLSADEEEALADGELPDARTAPIAIVNGYEFEIGHSSQKFYQLTLSCDRFTVEVGWAQPTADAKVPQVTVTWRSWYLRAVGFCEAFRAFKAWIAGRMEIKAATVSRLDLAADVATDDVSGLWRACGQFVTRAVQRENDVMPESALRVWEAKRKARKAREARKRAAAAALPGIPAVDSSEDEKVGAGWTEFEAYADSVLAVRDFSRGVRFTGYLIGSKGRESIQLSIYDKIRELRGSTERGVPCVTEFWKMQRAAGRVIFPNAELAERIGDGPLPYGVPYPDRKRRGGELVPDVRGSVWRFEFRLFRVPLQTLGVDSADDLAEHYEERVARLWAYLTGAGNTIDETGRRVGWCRVVEPRRVIGPNAREVVVEDFDGRLYLAADCDNGPRDERGRLLGVTRSEERATLPLWEALQGLAPGKAEPRGKLERPDQASEQLLEQALGCVATHTAATGATLEDVAHTLLTFLERMPALVADRRRKLELGEEFAARGLTDAELDRFCHMAWQGRTAELRARLRLRVGELAAEYERILSDPRVLAEWHDATGRSGRGSVHSDVAVPAEVALGSEDDGCEERRSETDDDPPF